MKPLSRRSVTTGLAAAVAVIPLVGLATSAVANPGDDKLLAVIGRYKAEVDAINASHEDLSDEEIDAWVNRADAILTEAAGLPALTAASALAALDLVSDEEDIGEHSIFGDQFRSLIEAIRGYIASTDGGGG